MKREQASKSGERCLALLILLLQSEEISRAEIVQRLPYTGRKMLDRDLSTLERAGVQLLRSGRSTGAVYRVSFRQFLKAE